MLSKSICGNLRPAAGRLSLKARTFGLSAAHPKTLEIVFALAAWRKAIKVQYGHAKKAFKQCGIVPFDPTKWIREEWTNTGEELQDMAGVSLSGQRKKKVAESLQELTGCDGPRLVSKQTRTILKTILNDPATTDSQALAEVRKIAHLSSIPRRVMGMRALREAARAARVAAQANAAGGSSPTNPQVSRKRQRPLTDLRKFLLQKL